MSIPPLHHESKKEFQLERLILFSDAVFAIAITLLVIEIKVPELHENVSDTLLLKSLGHLIPKFVGFLFSFLLIGLYWTVHHRMFGFVINYNRKLLWINLYFLFFIALMPFSTGFYSEYAGVELSTSAMEETSPQPAPGGPEGSHPVARKGLTQFGKEIVKHMNRLGMIVDVSHVGEQTFWDVIATTTKPVIASHSSVYALCPVFRNLKDDQIKAIGKNGGVIHLNFYSGFLDSGFMKKTGDFTARHKGERDSLMGVNPDPRVVDELLSSRYRDEVQNLRSPLSLLLDHLDYIVKLIGVDGVGLGSDFDGISSTPQELDDVTAYPVITKELVARGYSKKDIEKILGGNFLRVFKAVQAR